MAKKVYLKGEEFVFSRVKGNKESTYRDGDINLTPANIGASAEGHTHDDRYYTESEVDTKLNGKANASHGNHVPTTQTADNATFLRNDNTWAKVTPANIGAQPAGSYASASHTHDDRYYTESEINTKLNSKANSSHTHGNGDITSLDAGKITSGTISIDRLPQGALERLTVVADDTARFKLTSATVQKGDTVKVTSSGKMYYIVDETKLSTEDGYEVYAAGTAASVPWSGVTGKPSTYTPSSHTHSIANITNLQNTLDGKAASNHTHSQYLTSHQDISGKLDNSANGADSLLSKITPSWTTIPTDDTYFIRQDIGGGDTFGRVKFSTLWSYVKGKADKVYAALTHTHTKSEVGLGNVDNTADSAKSVKYATSAGSSSTSAKVSNKLTIASPINEYNDLYFRDEIVTEAIEYDGSSAMTVNLMNVRSDSYQNTVKFTSNDSTTGDPTAPSLLKSGETHASIFSKVSTIFKNVRWLLSKMGTTDISAIGNGTVTGALSTLNSNKQDSDTAITTSNIGSQTVYQATHIGNCEVQNVASGNKNYYLGADGGTNPIQWIPRNSMAVGYANNAGAVNGYAINYIEGKGTLEPSTYVAKGNAYYIRFGNVVILYCYDLIITPGTNNNSVIVSNLPASAKYFGVQRTNSGNQTLRFGMDSGGKELKVWWDSFSTVDGTNSKSWSFEIVYLCK